MKVIVTKKKCVRNDKVIKKRIEPKRLNSNSKLIFLFKILFKIDPYPIIEAIIIKYDDKKIIKFINIQFYLLIEI